MAPHSSTLARQIPWTEEPGGLQSTGLWRVGHDWATSLSLSCIGEGNGDPPQCSCLENPRDRGAGGLLSMGSHKVGHDCSDLAAAAAITKVKLISRVRLFATPWTVACQAPLFLGFSRQGYWSGLPFPSPGDLPYPGIKPGCPALQADSLPSEPLEIPTKKLWIKYIQNILVIIACSDFSFLKSLWGGKEEEKEKERNRDERENFLPIYLFAAGFSGGSEGKESA